MALIPRKTYPELTALTAPVVDADVLALYRTPGPLRRTTAGTLLAYIQAGFGTSAGSSYVGFLQAGTGAVLTTAQAKLRQAPVQPNSGEFGAFTTPTVTTATLLRAFTAAMLDGRAVELSGAYTIDGPITPASAVNGAELHIILRDDVTITVDAGSTPFNRVFYAESTTVRSHSISGGGTLTIDCNDKAAAGVWLRHTADEKGGTVVLSAPVTVKNLTGTATFTVAAGIIVLGRYARVIMQSPTVEDVTRSDASGECSGITTSGVEGAVEIYSPVVRRVYYGPGSGDADCIKCFGFLAGTAPGNAQNRRQGSVRIYGPIMEDGQARLYKDQCGNTVIYSPTVRRYAANGVSGTSSVDFDFQYGGGIVLDANVEYYKSGATSPISASHSVFAFQQVVDNYQMYAAARNTTIITDVAIPRVALVIESGFASTTEIDGGVVIPSGSLTTTAITDCLMEFDAGDALAKTTTTTLSVRNFSAPNTNPVIGYRGYVALDSGTATAGAATTLTNSAETWTVNQWVGYTLRITDGTGAGQTKAITSNTGTVLTVASAWTVTPDATSVYSIWYSAAAMALDSGTATAGAASTLTDSGKSWVTNQWANQSVRIVSGEGAGQIRTIASNTATILTVSEAWATTPDNTSVYSISSQPKLTVSVNGCATSLPITGDATRAVSDIADDPLRFFQAFEVGDNPGYRNWYRRLVVCPKRMRAGTKFSVLLDDSSFLDTDYSTPVSVPWGTSGTLSLKCDGVTNTNVANNDTVIVAYLNAASPNSWFTLDGGLNWRTGN